MRIIAAVQIKGADRAVKTEKFANARYLGDPMNIIRILNAKGAQEIAVFDLQASVSGAIDYFEIEKLSGETSVPLSYGGGINLNTDVRKLSRLGVERFVLSRFIGEDETLVQNLVDKLGSSSVSISLDIDAYKVEGSEILICLRRYPGTVLPLRDILEKLLKLQVGEVIIRPVCLDGSNGEESVELYSHLLKDNQLKPFYQQVRILAGTGIRSIDIAESISQSSLVDGFVVGSLVCFSKSGGVLTSYPEKFSVL